MSGTFFEDLSLPNPDISLGVGPGSHATQTAEIMKRFEPALIEQKPDLLIVAGDVNSTVACALVASKISFDSAERRPLIAHVEAGLRSFDQTMPEETNRILVDRLSDLLFVTEESGLINLDREGIPAEKVYFVGNTMIDSLVTYSVRAERSRVLDDLGLRDFSSGSVTGYGLLTLHRPANVDVYDAFSKILEGLGDLAQRRPILFPVHPRTKKRIAELGLERYFVDSDSTSRAGIRLLEPLGYLDFLCLMKHATIVVTDSGGIQEETTFLGIPCVTVRENTERPVTLTHGTNVLAGIETERIREAVRQQLWRTPSKELPRLWDGNTATRIVRTLYSMLFTHIIPAQSAICLPACRSINAHRRTGSVDL
jgi:UDP-N-acetylglucosamine 2-epimerase (non-hydrolysing)